MKVYAYQYWLLSSIALGFYIFTQYESSMGFTKFFLMLETSTSLGLIFNFALSSIYLIIKGIQIFFFGNDLLVGEILLITDKLRYKLIFLVLNIYFIFRTINLENVVFLISILIAWIFCWITNFRAEHYPTQIHIPGMATRDSTQGIKNFKLVVCYGLQIFIHFNFFLYWKQTKYSILLDLAMFEIGMIFLQLMKKGVKYMVNYYEGITEDHFIGKKHYFLIWDLGCTSSAAAIQIYFLLRFQGQGKYQLFVRDIYISVIQSFAMAKQVFSSLKMSMKVRNLKNVEDNEELCGICLHLLKKGKALRCGHQFHESCLVQLIQQPQTAKNCPVCRKKIIVGKKGIQQKEEEEVTHGLTDTDRRVTRLKKHLGSLKKLKYEYVGHLISIVMTEDLTYEIYDKTHLWSLFEDNYHKILLNKPGSKLEGHDDNFTETQKTEIFGIIRSSLKNGNSVSAPGYSFGSLKISNSATPVGSNEIQKCKVEIFTILYRIYRSRKHLGFTSTDIFNLSLK